MFSYGNCRKYLEAVAACADALDLQPVRALREDVDRAHLSGGTVFVAGNGGGATVAEHFVLGLTLNAWRETGRPVRAVSLNASAAVLSAAVNDFGQDGMYAAQLRALGRAGDLFVALSASGKSPNLVAAMDTARDVGMQTAAIVGLPGAVSERAQAAVVLNTDCAAIAEDVAIMLLHWLYGTYMGSLEAQP